MDGLLPRVLEGPSCKSCLKPNKRCKPSRRAGRPGAVPLALGGQVQEDVSGPFCWFSEAFLLNISARLIEAVRTGWDAECGGHEDATAQASGMTIGNETQPVLLSQWSCRMFCP